MRLGKKQLADLRLALELAILEEQEFARAHIKPYTDGEVMDGFADVLLQTEDRIKRFKALHSKISEEMKRRE